MKSRTRRINLTKSKKPYNKMIGGGKKYNFALNTHMDGLSFKFKLSIVVKSPKSKTFFRKERKEYLFDLESNIPFIQQLGKSKINNLNINEFINLFINENQHIDIKINRIQLVFDIINLIKITLYDNIGNSHDQIYLKGLSLLLDNFQDVYFKIRTELSIHQELSKDELSLSEKEVIIKFKNDIEAQRNDSVHFQKNASKADVGSVSKIPNDTKAEKPDIAKMIALNKERAIQENVNFDTTTLNLFSASSQKKKNREGFRW